MRNVIIWHWFHKSLLGTWRRNDVDATSLRHIDVLTTSCACWKFAPSPSILNICSPPPRNILNLPTPMLVPNTSKLFSPEHTQILISCWFNVMTLSQRWFNVDSPLCIWFVGFSRCEGPIALSARYILTWSVAASFSLEFYHCKWPWIDKFHIE